MVQPVRRLFDRRPVLLSGGEQLRCHQCSCPKGNAHCRRRRPCEGTAFRILPRPGLRGRHRPRRAGGHRGDYTRSGAIRGDYHRSAPAGADGFEVLRAAREPHSSVYVVMITGYASIDSAVRAVREGAYNYLAKPFARGQPEVLLKRIRDGGAGAGESRTVETRGQPRCIAGPHGSRMASSGDRKRLAHIEALLRTRG
jgi:hypothetical protein